MTGTSARLLALAFGTCAAALLACALRGLLPDRAGGDFDRAAIAHLLEQRAASFPTEAPAARDYAVSESVARTLFPVQSAGQRYDPVCYYAHRPNLKRRIEWAEHPAGSWVYRTNSIGMREDGEALPEPPDLRVLVAGDSHTEGFCDNRDSFPNLLEARLADHFPGRSVEILNAADGGYSFYNYLGVLKKHLELEPDLFLMAVYGGNDFKEVLLPYRYFQGRTLLKDEAALTKQARARSISGSASTQAFGSLLHFNAYPQESSMALEAAVEVTLEIQRICRERSIGFLCVYLPAPTHTDWEHHADLFERMASALELSPEDMQVLDQLADRYLMQVRAAGVAAVDLRPQLARERTPLFWSRDFHLNLDGHAAVAAALWPHLLERAEVGGLKR